MAIRAVVLDGAWLEDWDNALDSHPHVPEQFTEFRDVCAINRPDGSVPISGRMWPSSNHWGS
jgi:hypothetical protein